MSAMNEMSVMLEELRGAAGTILAWADWLEDRFADKSLSTTAQPAGSTNEPDRATNEPVSAISTARRLWSWHRFTISPLAALTRSSVPGRRIWTRPSSERHCNKCDTNRTDFVGFCEFFTISPKRRLTQVLSVLYYELTK